MKLLDTYWHKRNFKVTPEPRGKIINSKKELSYFIQRHHARSLHYDFRLELNGTLKSWAVPKGPSLDPADKRLAVHVEDHPLAYGTFEGVIPPKQYGAGEVVLWDQGVWVPLEDPAEGYRKGRLKFELKGEKLAGKWALVRMGKPGNKENWLLIKEKDEEARSGDNAHITELRPESVKGIEKKKTSSKAQATRLDLASVTLPLKLSPQLATLVKTAPEGDEWLSEIKYDGYRALTRIKDGKAAIYTRNGNDWTTHWPDLAKKLSKLPIDEAWLDGEVVAFKDRTINFAALQNYEGDDSHIELKYFVFDVVFLNGQDISHLPLIDRKSLLKELLSSQNVNSPILYSEHIVGNAQKVFNASCEKGMEGIVIKRADSPYYQTRTNNWLKLKCIQRQEFVIGGYTDPAGSRTGFGALLLGYYDENGEFIYAGRVGTGFDDKTLTALSKNLTALTTTKSPYKVSPKKRDAIGIHWLKPVLIAEVNFAEWTSDGLIRHSSFVGLRSDKLPKKIIREVPVKAEDIQAASNMPSALHKTTPTPGSTDDTVAGIKITHPDRVIFGEEHISKFDLAEYYRSVERWIMPHLIGRPLSLLRCPDGTEKECFFQKHLNTFYIKQIETIEISGHDTGKYMVANDLPSLISLVQMGVVELHTWGSRTPSLHKPDRIIFDLDPDPKLPWAKIMEGANLTKYFLDNIGLQSFLKTTGGKGLHIVVPIKPELNFSEIKAFSRAIAEHLADTVPTHFTANMSKLKRLDKIYVDYLRNGEEATAVSAYSVRARPGAPISVPLRWEELNEDMSPNRFNMKNIQKRLLALTSDPWEGYFDHKQRITPAMRKIFR